MRILLLIISKIFIIFSQFEILGITENADYLKSLYINGCQKYDRPYINGKRIYSRLLIKRKQ
jgi:hypothetical protein